MQPGKKLVRGIRTEMECSLCGLRQSIQRLAGRTYKAGHVKHLWCIRCRAATAHVQVGGGQG